MKKALIIAYDFPPTRTGGVYRPLKFAKYLPQFGWRPFILTVRNYPRDWVDPALLNELPPETMIDRAYSWELIRLEKAIYKRLFMGTEKPSPGAGSFAHVKSKPGKTIPSLMKRLFFSPMSWFTSNFLYIPDDKIGWTPLAVYKGLKIVRKEKIDLIYSTSPPETNHIVALFLQLLTGKPWIADFRDPWTDNTYRPNFHRIRLKFENWLEHTVIHKADIIINVGYGLAQLAKAKFADIPAEKHHVITNGFDEANFKGLISGEIYEQNRTEYLNLVNVGTIYEESAFEYFLKGFARVLANGKISDDIRINFVGDLIPAWRRILSEPPYKDHVNLTGFRPHRETIKLMMTADVLLLMPFGGDNKMADKIITGKVFELMRTGRPIFMIGWEGECSKIIERSGLGKFVPFHDIDQIADTILEYYKKKQNGELKMTPDWDYIKRFERKALTGELVELFEAARRKCTTKK